MTHYVKCVSAVSLFNGAVKLSVDDRLQLTDAQFADSSVTAAITAGSLVVLNAQGDMLKLRGSYPITIGDKQLVEDENVAVDSTLGNIQILLNPNPIPGSYHHIVPAKDTWNVNNVYLVSSKKFMGVTGPHILNANSPVHLVYVDDTYGWKVNVGGGAGGGTAIATDWVNISTSGNYTAEVNKGYLCSLAGGDITIALPDGAAEDSEVIICNLGGSLVDNLVVTGGSTNIAGQSDLVKLDVAQATYKFIKRADSTGWQVLASGLSLQPVTVTAGSDVPNKPVSNGVYQLTMSSGTATWTLAPLTPPTSDGVYELSIVAGLPSWTAVAGGNTLTGPWDMTPTVVPSGTLKLDASVGELETLGQVTKLTMSNNDLTGSLTLADTTTGIFGGAMPAGTFLSGQKLQFLTGTKQLQIRLIAPAIATATGQPINMQLILGGMTTSYVRLELLQESTSTVGNLYINDQNRLYFPISPSASASINGLITLVFNADTQTFTMDVDGSDMTPPDNSFTPFEAPPFISILQPSSYSGSSDIGKVFSITLYPDTTSVGAGAYSALPVGAAAGDVYEVTVGSNYGNDVFSKGDLALVRTNGSSATRIPRAIADKASLIQNDSTVPGSTVRDALQALTTVTASGVTNDSTVTGATVKAALETLAINPDAATPWVDATLLNGWIALDAGTNIAQYRLVGTRVDVRFRLIGGTASTLFNLPVNYRPLAPVGFVVSVHDNTNAPDFGHIRVSTNGDLLLEHPGTLNNHSVWGTFSYFVD